MFPSTSARWPKQKLVRFAFGGAIAVIAGILVKRFGPCSADFCWRFPLFFPQAPRQSQNTKPRRNKRRESQPAPEAVRRLPWMQRAPPWEALVSLVSPQPSASSFLATILLSYFSQQPQFGSRWRS